MYDTHTTEAIVLDAIPVGEADKDLVLLTKAHGMLRARIGGVRKLESKNRYHISEGARTYATLVKGKVFWRVTSVRDSKEERVSREARMFRAKIAVLVRRLVHGETAEDMLFEYIDRAFEYINVVEPNADAYVALEHLIALRICHVLGYVGEEAELVVLLGTTSITDSHITHAGSVQKQIAEVVNTALYASHL